MVPWCSRFQWTNNDHELVMVGGAARSRALASRWLASVCVCKGVGTGVLKGVCKCARKGVHQKVRRMGMSN